MLDAPLSQAPKPRPRLSAFAWFLPRESQAQISQPDQVAAGDLPRATARFSGPPVPATAQAANVSGPQRAAAHAAFAAVEGGGPRALDAALAVVETDAHSLRRRLIACEEALKLLRLYAADHWVRSVAEQALAAPQAPLAPCLPCHLFDPDLADQTPCSCGDAR